MKTRQVHPGLTGAHAAARVARLSALALSGASITGCASSQAPQWDRADRAQRFQDRNTLVFESPQVQLSDAGATLPFERFEFARNDAATNVVHRVPLVATNAWPQPLRPAERRIRFSDWEQR